MTQLQEALITKAQTTLKFDKSDEYIELIRSTEDVPRLREIFTALEDAYKNRDYLPPSLPPISKEIFEFEIPSKKVATAHILKKMEKELPAPVFNQFMRLTDGKMKLDQDHFGPVIGKLLDQTFKGIECTAHEAFFCLQTAAMQFGLQESGKALIELISDRYTEHIFNKETNKYKQDCVIAETNNTLVEELTLKLNDWKSVAERVLADKHLNEIFPWLTECDIDDEDLPDKLAGIVCIKIDKTQHVLLEPDTLKHTFEVGDKEDVIIYIEKQVQYINPLCVIEKMVEDKEGDLVKKKVFVQDLYRNHLTIAQFTEYDLRSPFKYELSRDRKQVGIKQSGVTRANIDPIYDENCDRWLKLLTGNNYAPVLAWVAHSFDFSVPLPVLSFLGPANTGKSLLMMAILEQIKNAEASLTPIMYEESGFNGALLTNPFIVADDGGLFVTPENRELWQDRFKKYVTHSSWSVNPKYGGQTTLNGHIRSYCAFNKDKPHIRSLFFEENDALGQRIFDVEVPEENLKQLIKLFLECDVLGEHDYNNRWLINGKLTKHVAWVIENRKDFPVIKGTGRWGNMTTYKFKGALAASQSEQQMLEFIQNSIKDNVSYARTHEISKSKVVILDLRILLDAYKVQSGDRRVTEKNFKDMFRSIGAENKVSNIEGKNKRGWRLAYEDYLETLDEQD